jgi:hypothetical protein
MSASEVHEYIESVLNHVQCDVLKTGLDVLDNYGQGDMAYFNCLNAIYIPDVDNDYRIEEIRNIISVCLDKVLLEHGIELSREAGIEDKNEILYAMYVLQNLDSYNDLCRWLESDEEDMEVFIFLMKTYSALGEIRLREIVLSLGVGMIEGLKRYASDRYEETANASAVEYGHRAKIIAKYVHSESIILDSKCALGASFSSYLGLFGDSLKEYTKASTVENTVKELLCILLLSAEASADMRGQWDRYISDYVTNTEDIVKADIFYHKYLQMYIDGMNLEKMEKSA